MLSKTLITELNTQVKRELDSAYVYFSMATYAMQNSLDGCAHWLQVQAQEEIGHALKLHQYLVDRGAEISLQTIEAPKSDYTSILDVFEAALAQERELQRELDEIAKIASAEGDNTTSSLLEWYLTEQVEEIATAEGLVDKFKLVGTDGTGLLILNQELSKRQPEETPA